MSENLRSAGILSVVPPGRGGLDSLTLGDIFCRALRLSVVSGPGGMDHLAVGERSSDSNGNLTDLELDAGILLG